MSWHPELEGYEPIPEKPLRSRAMAWVIRVVVVLGVVALVLPGMITTASTAERTAQAACAIWVDYLVDGPSGAEARFEIFGASGIGWECYSVGAFGGDGHVASLGLIPGAPQLPGNAPYESPAVES